MKIKLPRPATDNVRERRTLALVGVSGGRTDVDKASDALVFAQAQGGAYRLVVGDPLGDPGRTVAQRVGGEAQVEAGSASRQDLLPLGRAAMGRDPRYHGNDQRRAHQPGALRLEPHVRGWLLLR